MGLLDNYSEKIGWPRPMTLHQIILSRLISNFSYELRALDNYYILQEEPVTYDRNDLTPDLIIKDFDNDELLLAVEITTTYDLRKICEKCVELAERFPFTEFWIWDYDRRKLYWVDHFYEVREYYEGQKSAYLQHPFIEYFNYKTPVNPKGRIQ